MLNKLDFTKIFRMGFIFFGCFLLISCSKNKVIKHENAWELISPNAKIISRVNFKKSGQISYQVFSGYKEEGLMEVIKPSTLGIIRKDQAFDSLIFIGSEKIETVKETYNLSTGKQLKNLNHYSEITLHFQNQFNSKLDIVFRAYNEGVTFKYVFPEVDEHIYVVTKELSEFNIQNNGTAWIQPYDIASAYAPAYERNFEKDMPIGTSAPSKEGWAFPALFETNKHWVLITEANLKDNFYGSHLNQNSKDGIYSITAPNEDEAFGYGNNRAESSLPWDMPWRVIFVGNQLADIVESNLVNHVSDSSKIKDTSWIQSGRASWAWWSGYIDNSSDTPKKLKAFIDFAQTMKWEYSLVDAGWDSREDLDITELVKYADNKNVKLILWYNSGGPINKVEAGPRDFMFYPEIRRKEMERISNLGIKGVKIDFFGSDKQDFIKLYLEILRDAAHYKLLVNFHGCTLPRGWSRTYPNLISMESVKGAEGYIYHSDFEDKAPVHNSVLPFTRNVVGPMDYTPTAFSFQQFPHKTTFGHELALSVIFESAIQHFPDTPQSYLKQPDYVLEFLKTIPTVWDKTTFLSGYPGKEVVLARKNNENWFVGGINADEFSKEIEINFSFLDEGKFEAEIINDGKNNLEFSSEFLEISKKSTKKITLKPFGGFVVRIKKQN